MFKSISTFTEIAKQLIVVYVLQNQICILLVLIYLFSEYISIHFLNIKRTLDCYLAILIFCKLKRNSTYIPTLLLIF